MLKDDLIVILSKNVLKRYEYNLNEGDGILFLYDVETTELWASNGSSNELIKLINGQRTLKDIYTSLQSVFEGYEYQELKESFDSIIKDLMDKDFLKEVVTTKL